MHNAFGAGSSKQSAAGGVRISNSSHRSSSLREPMREADLLDVLRQV